MIEVRTNQVYSRLREIDRAACLGSNAKLVVSLSKSSPRPLPLRLFAVGYKRVQVAEEMRLKISSILFRMGI